jgi:hypothetical protein
MAEALKQPARQKFINRMIRCRRTFRYFKNGDWTEDPVQASTFSDQIEVVRTCVRYGLNNIGLVLRVPGGETDLFCTPIR